MVGTQKKSWWKSTTIWGGLVAVLAGIGGAIGLDAAGLATDLNDTVAGVIAAVGGVISIVGRFKARHKLGE